MHANPVINSDGEIEKAGCIVLNDDGQILLVTNKQRDAWGLPKGHAEQGETPVEVALRETREESGYDVEIIKIAGDMTYVNHENNLPIRVHYFIAKPLHRHADADEAWAWVALEQAMTLVLPNVAALLSKSLGTASK